MSLTALSYGGGVQSTALLVLAARGEIAADVALFANVGDDSERAETLAYVRRVAAPFGARHGVQIVEVARAGRTLYQDLTRPDSRSVRIPMRMANGAPGNRSCTGEWKIKPVARWLRSRVAKGEAATLMLGISLDELQRMRSASGFTWVRLAYPLVELRLDRVACAEMIKAAGLPLPPKSACWFCPYQPLFRWRMLKQAHPETFARAVALEGTLNERRAALGRDPVWFTRRAIPIARAVGEDTQGTLWDESDGFACGPFACSGDGADRSRP